MRDALDVYLESTFVGRIIREERGRIYFAFAETFKQNPQRPTLSQSFLDREGGVDTTEPAASSGLIPTFFSNLLPEGRLRSYLAERAGVSVHREFELIELLGTDLPGAVHVHRIDEAAYSVDPSIALGSETESNQGPLRFSLAGIQLKFSAFRQERGGMAIPAHGVGGDWIVKPPSAFYPGVPENEFSVMSMARQVGIETPEVQLVPLVEIGGLPDEVHTLEESDAFVIKRFDRPDGRRVHIEDFAQALGYRPAGKYPHKANFTDVARTIQSACGEKDVLDFSRRLMYSALVGNSDMHLKNWSFIYTDGRTPHLAPAYDYLCITAYLEGSSPALKIGSARKWHELTLDDFAEVASGAGVNSGAFVDAAVDAVERFQECWVDYAKSLPINDDVRSSIDGQLTSCPAITAALRKTPKSVDIAKGQASAPSRAGAKIPSKSVKMDDYWD